MQSATPKVLLPSVWPFSISLAATLKIDFSFSSSAYLDVSVQRVPSIQLCIHYMVTEYCSAGFPHSEICGSMAICALPQLIAAYHVLHRLLMPRHSPCALVRLTNVLVLQTCFHYGITWVKKYLINCAYLPFYGKTQFFLIFYSLHCSVFKVQFFVKTSNVFTLVGLGGLEPPTSRLSGVRSSLLRYKPIFNQA